MSANNAKHGNTSTHKEQITINHEPSTICGTWELEGLAAQLVIEKQNQMLSEKGKKIGKERALHLLLVELHFFRKQSEDPTTVSGLVDLLMKGFAVGKV